MSTGSLAKITIALLTVTGKKERDRRKQRASVHVLVAMTLQRYYRQQNLLFAIAIKSLIKQKECSLKSFLTVLFFYDAIFAVFNILI